jgi:hypothetical protein
LPPHGNPNPGRSVSSVPARAATGLRKQRKMSAPLYQKTKQRVSMVADLLARLAKD